MSQGARVKKNITGKVSIHSRACVKQPLVLTNGAVVCIDKNFLGVLKMKQNLVFCGIVFALVKNVDVIHETKV